MLKVGLIGTRGLVGSTLLERMRVENDFAKMQPTFFSSTAVGQSVPAFSSLKYVHNEDFSSLRAMDIILSCQGSNYTAKIYSMLRESGWAGYFIDAASHLRLAEDAIICLDPVNASIINRALHTGIKTFVGGNCTVSLMLMATAKLLKTGLVESLTSMTYQAASGAGSQGMQDLLGEMQELSTFPIPRVAEYFQQDASEKAMGGVLAGNVLPWIDSDDGHGISKEEAKMQPEAMKILGLSQNAIPMDSFCVRVGALRCHSQALTIRLKQQISHSELIELIASNNPWVRVIDNDKKNSLQYLTPAAVTGTLDIAVGRIRPLNIPGFHWGLFTVGDQLLWGAAEPLRRVLQQILTYVDEMNISVAK